MGDFEQAPLDDASKALCRWAVKLTRTPGACGKPDVDALRAAGLSDEQIVHAAQVIGYFNYINRIADGLGVDLEPGMAGKSLKPGPKPL